MDSFFVGIAKILIGLFAFAGLFSLVLLVMIIQSFGLDALFDLGAVIGNGSEEPITSQQHTGHLLSVVIISLSGVALLATVITASATFGLIAHARSLKRDIQDEIGKEIVSLSHEVFKSMARIENVWVQSKASLDIAVYEWKARSAWMDDDKEKELAIVRGYVAASRAKNNINEAQQRLLEEGALHRNIDIVRKHTDEMADELNILQAFIDNTLAFYLAALEEIKLLENDRLCERGLIPKAEEAKADAVHHIDTAIALLEKTRLKSDYRLAQCQLGETALFVRDRMKVEDQAALIDRFNALWVLVEKTRSQLSRREERKELDRWWYDRKLDYSHLWSDDAGREQDD